MKPGVVLSIISGQGTCGDASQEIWMQGGVLRRLALQRAVAARPFPQSRWRHPSHLPHCRRHLRLLQVPPRQARRDLPWGRGRAQGRVKKKDIRQAQAFERVRACVLAAICARQHGRRQQRTTKSAQNTGCAAPTAFAIQSPHRTQLTQENAREAAPPVVSPKC